MWDKTKKEIDEKKMRKIFGIFDRRPLIWLHYVLLVLSLFPVYFLGKAIFGNLFNNFFIMFIWFFVFVSLVDQLIHKILGVD